MKLEIKLNAQVGGQVSASSALAQAAQRKKDATETMEDAWVRILAQRNTDADLRKLREVKRAMEAGLIGREPPKTDKQGKVKPLGRFSKAEAIRLYAVLFEQQREAKLAELVANTPSNYVLITDEQSLRQVVTDALKEPIIAVDTETTGLDVYVDVIVGVSLTLPSIDKHYYIPFEPSQDERTLPSEMLGELKSLMESQSVAKVLHNALYDMAMFERHGIKLNNVVWDTQWAMHMLNENENQELPNRKKGTFRLKDLATKYLKEPSDTYDEMFGKNAKFAEVPLDVALVYAAKDTDLTWRLYEFQRLHLSKEPTMLEYFENIEMKLLDVVYRLERHGYVLDMDFAKQYGEKLAAEAKALYDDIIAELQPHHEGNGIINLNAPEQKRVALSKAIGRELPNMDAKRTLKPLRKEFPIIEKLLEYARITKLAGTYIDTLPLKQNPVTKRWHSRFNPMGTVTSRFSSGKDEEKKESNEFNVQNIPADARPMFVAPKGKVLVSADFKAQEIRGVAHLSREPALLEAFRLGRDPYAMLAMQYTGLPYEQVNKNPDGSDTEWRKKMKVVWLAWLYGSSNKTLAEWLGTSEKEASKFMDELKSTLPILSGWLKGNIEFAQKNGFVWMDKQQRKRRLPMAKEKRKKIPWGKYWDEEYKKERAWNAEIGKASRSATNSRVQGSSAIQTKVTMIEATKECQKREGWALWATVHDELIFELPEDFTQDDLKVIERIMTQSYKWDGIENETDIAIMRKWGEEMTPEEWFKQKEETE